MNQNKSHTIINIVIGILIIASGVFSYMYFRKGDTESTETQITASQLSSQQIIARINNLEKIKLNKDIVLRQDFISLQDIKQTIPAQPTGVRNPFR